MWTRVVNRPANISILIPHSSWFRWATWFPWDTCWKWQHTLGQSVGQKELITPHGLAFYLHPWGRMEAVALPGSRCWDEHLALTWGRGWSWYLCWKVLLMDAFLPLEKGAKPSPQIRYGTVRILSLSDCSVPGTVLGSLQALSHLIFTTPQLRS